jgi:hypothetical protein
MCLWKRGAAVRGISDRSLDQAFLLHVHFGLTLLFLFLLERVLIQCNFVLYFLRQSLFVKTSLTLNSQFSCLSLQRFSAVLNLKSERQNGRKTPLNHFFPNLKNIQGQKCS